MGTSCYHIGHRRDGLVAKINILGFSVEVPTTYSAGHVCTASEAETLNRILTRTAAKGLYKTLSAGLASRLVGADEDLTQAMRAELIELANGYVERFTLGFSQGHERLAAVEVEARRIATSVLEAALYRRGQKLADLHEHEREDKVRELMLSENVRREAETRIDGARALAGAAHEELLASIAGGQDDDI
jgi:hypothetical protein